ncbi:unannotated protein [freshwater metagenome]|uniref:Unannotated protein n=1 Tax=freshwater metagenome TaxID=449393 RepID=A0A6J6IX52_9ZZZZ
MVLTQGLLLKPFSTAFLASNAAAIITDGLDVLVHDVIDAITTSPFPTDVDLPLTLTSTLDLLVFSEKYVGKTFS